jgi:hypothetical protein
MGLFISSLLASFTINPRTEVGIAIYAGILLHAYSQEDSIISGASCALAAVVTKEYATTLVPVMTIV